MAAKRVSLTTSLRHDIKEGLVTYCEENGLKINRTLERLIVDFLRLSKSQDSQPCNKKEEQE